MKNRDQLLKLPKDYTKIPNEIFRLGLDPITICIYCLICQYTESFNPTLRYLAGHLGVHRNSVCKALKRLCDCGVLKKLQQGFVMRIPGSQRPDSASVQSLYEMRPVREWTKFVNVDDTSTLSISENSETKE